MPSQNGIPTHDSDQDPDFKASFHVLIIGAGLVGLGLAILLRKAGYKVTILERDTELREVWEVDQVSYSRRKLPSPKPHISAASSPPHSQQPDFLIRHTCRQHNNTTPKPQIGAGVQLPANHNKVLLEMGLLDTITAQSIVPPSIKLHSYNTGAELTTLPLDPYVRDTYGVPHLVIHRADLRRTLATTATSHGAQIRLGTKITPQNTSFACARVSLSSGETLQGNLLIGADGESSTCREALLGRPSPPRPIGRLSNRIVIPAAEACTSPLVRELIDPPHIHTWLGPGCQALCYLMHGALNIVMNRPMCASEEIFSGPRPVDIEELRDVFRGWDPRICALLELTRDFMKWISVETEELQDWVHEDGKFCLIGDAAHATQPYL